MSTDKATVEQRIAGLSREKREYLERLLKEKQNTQTIAIPKRKRSDTAPLSYAQQRMWILAQFTKDSPFYNEIFSRRLTFPLDVPAFERSINEIIIRHEVLRTGFRIENGEPVQVIAPSLKMPLKCVDLRNWPLVQREAKAQELIQLEASRPFDLNRDIPFMRASLVRMGDNDHLFF